MEYIERPGPDELAAAYGKHCWVCGELDPPDYIECRVCCHFICGDCLSEEEDDSGMCDSCARNPKLKTAPAVLVSDDAVVRAARRVLHLSEDEDDSGIKTAPAVLVSDDAVVRAARRVQ